MRRTMYSSTSWTKLLSGRMCRMMPPRHLAFSALLMRARAHHQRARAHNQSQRSRATTDPVPSSALCGLLRNTATCVLLEQDLVRCAGSDRTPSCKRRSHRRRRSHSTKGRSDSWREAWWSCSGPRTFWTALSKHTPSSACAYFLRRVPLGERMRASSSLNQSTEFQGALPARLPPPLSFPLCVETRRRRSPSVVLLRRASAGSTWGTHESELISQSEHRVSLREPWRRVSLLPSLFLSVCTIETRRVALRGRRAPAGQELQGRTARAGQGNLWVALCGVLLMEW
jgi:hypothetical protein